MDLSTIVLAQEAAPQGGIMSFLPFIVIFAAMYFLIIAPQRKKQKQHQKMITELKSGAEVVTSGGIYGTITNVKDDRFILKVAENTKIEVSKAAVASVVTAAE
ncbi:preprotein translocase subunit YajC [Pelagicoccus sp. SDUM812002]|uniref:preprotein translocase subunit YajC n=1 Tax=Pelagicoccus sp. SDUM812002 TaxID=3041266 RepID=UPI00280FE195|nr:preprotein translocase subunit YajC [Pelagicoccus sp. SDUM812002]MDQ8187752.1 preprotein translocase subunit YajC [Pelagicoccus sp. SDUM812002]